jgi:tRNA(Ile)-lysidine synthase
MDVILPKSGKYVVAVSGGVDSVALLDMLRRESGLDLVVAHFDHGIRTDSFEDRALVESLAKSYGLPFVYKEGKLDANVSEAVAREARYSFLREVLAEQGAQAIITAHHQDDLLETAILNMLRGTSRKGLSSLRSRDDLVRPLLKVPKSQVLDYAVANGLKWHEDSTNRDTAYLRNYVRHNILTRLDNRDKTKLVNMLSNMEATNKEIDWLLDEILAEQISANRLDRRWFNQLAHSVAREVMATWLRANGLRDFDSKTLERLVVAGKTAVPGKRFDVLKGAGLSVSKDYLALEGLER